MSRPNPFLAFPKAATASFFALAVMSLSGTASAQQGYQVYSETFTSGYQAGYQLDGQAGWTSNDSYTGGSYTYNTTQNGEIGSDDYVGYIPYVSTGLNDYVGYLGGQGQGYVPGVAATTGPVTLTQALPTAPAASLVFSTDFQINGSSAYGPHDAFAITLNGTAGTQIGINFVVPGNNSATADNVTYSTGLSAMQSAPIASIQLGSQRYKLTINVNVTAGTFSAALQAETPAGLLSGNAITLVPAGTSYGTGAITGYGVDWTLADKTTVTPANNPLTAGSNAVAHTDSGSNGIYFDNVLVTIPEPSTYALLGFGVVGLTLVVRRSRSNRAA